MSEDAANISFDACHEEEHSCTDPTEIKNEKECLSDDEFPPLSKGCARTNTEMSKNKEPEEENQSNDLPKDDNDCKSKTAKTSSTAENLEKSKKIISRDGTLPPR